MPIEKFVCNCDILVVQDDPILYHLRCRIVNLVYVSPEIVDICIKFVVYINLFLLITFEI